MAATKTFRTNGSASFKLIFRTFLPRKMFQFPNKSLLSPSACWLYTTVFALVVRQNSPRWTRAQLTHKTLNNYYNSQSFRLSNYHPLDVIHCYVNVSHLPVFTIISLVSRTCEQFTWLNHRDEPLAHNLSIKHKPTPHYLFRKHQSAKYFANSK